MEMKKIYIKQLILNSIILAIIGSLLILKQAKADEFCKSAIINICNSPEVDNYEKAKTKFKELKKAVYQSPDIKGLLEGILGPPPNRRGIKHWFCQDLLQTRPVKKINPNELRKKYNECQEMRHSAIQKILFPRQTQERIERLFERTKNHIIDNINKIISPEKQKKDERLSAMVNEVLKTRIIFSQSESRWNISFHKFEPTLRVEGMALLAEIDLSYLVGMMYHEWGHIINPFRFPLDNYERSHDIPFYENLSCLKDIGFARYANTDCYQRLLLVLCSQGENPYCKSLKTFINLYSNFPMLSYESPLHLPELQISKSCQNDQTIEAFPDLIMVEMLAKEMTISSVSENRSRIKKYLAQLCSEYQEVSNMNAHKRYQRTLNTYPDPELRLLFVLNNPKIRKAVGCDPVQADRKFFCSLEN